MTQRTLSRQFGRYLIERELGTGGMGTVYLAHDTALKRLVALKIPQLSTSRQPQVIERFHREAQVAASIEHPNVCSILDIGEIDGIHYLTMPYIQGISLAQRKDPEHPWPLPEASLVISRLARALEALHTRGLIHRDLKPGNVLLREDGEPILVDFGLARSFVNPAQRLTRTGQTLGTPAYMSPEQVLGAADQGPATDVYALGAIFYELLTGQVPFAPGSVEKLYGLILHASPRPPSEMHTSLTSCVDAVVLKALAKDPADRYPSMKDLDEALQGFLQAGETRLPVVAFAPADVTRTTKRPLEVEVVRPNAEQSVVRGDSSREERKHHRTRRGWLLAGALFLLGVGVVIWLFLGQGQPTQESSRPQWQTGKSKPPRNGPGPPNPPVVQPPTSWIRNSVGMKLVHIPAGTFIMGSSSEEQQEVLRSLPRNVFASSGKEKLVAMIQAEGPQHEVTLTHPLYMGVHEVTQEQFHQVMGYNPSYFANTAKGKPGVIYQKHSMPGGGLDKSTPLDTRAFPVENVSWDEAVDFCKKLSSMREEKRAGRVYRLPSEAEWEYACREAGKSTTLFSCGNTITSEQANFNGSLPYGTNSKGTWLKRTTVVGSYKPNALGLYDMHGNVWEWCADWYDEDYYGRSPRQNPTGPATEITRVLRGGSWYYLGAGCRSALRNDDTPGTQFHDIGFRVVAVIVPNNR